MLEFFFFSFLGDNLGWTTIFYRLIVGTVEEFPNFGANQLYPAYQLGIPGSKGS